MRVGIFQAEAGVGSPMERLVRLEDALRAQPCDLVVTPELFLSGYDVGDAIRDLAEPCDGALSKEVAGTAQRTSTAIVFGYPERDGDNIYNAAACVARDGTLVANHRKLLLPPGFEATYFTRGSGTTVFDLDGVRFGLLICYDAEFPESVRALAEAGADTVLVPTALFDSWHSVAFRMMPTRAFENGVWFVYANHAGAEGESSYLGASCILGPDGEDAARAGAGEELISAELDLSRIPPVRKRLPYVTDVVEMRARLKR